MKNDPATLAFYAREAAAYAIRPRRAESKDFQSFLARLPARAHVLDLGCGGGQDALAMMQAGFQVTAMDGSPELALRAERRLGCPVRVQLFEDLGDIEIFDGVWANASLLHVPKPALAMVVRRIWNALKPGGLFYASFKSGGAEGRDALGRYYNHPDKDELIAALPVSAWDEREVMEGTGAGYDGVVTAWLSVTARKSAPLANPRPAG